MISLYKDNNNVMYLKIYVQLKYMILVILEVERG